MIDFSRLFEALRPVDYVLIGGVAAAARGSARVTQDLDVVYRRSRENYRALVAALSPLNPYPRGAPEGLPFAFDERTLMNGLNFTLQTSLGSLDLLGEVPGMTTYEELISGSTELQLFGGRVHCVNLTTLIRLKRASGRPKDFEVIAELEALLEEEK